MPPLMTSPLVRKADELTSPTQEEPEEALKKQKQQRLDARTKMDIVKGESRVIFNKIIEGRFRDGNGYEEVGVLFVSWKDDDMTVNEEVDRLEGIFRHKFRFHTEIFHIPSLCPETTLHSKISDWARRFDSPNKMSIIYYGGHGGYMNEAEHTLKLSARSKPFYRGNPSAMFHDAVHALKLADTDLFLIIDCCYAGRAFAEKEIGRRKYELLAASSPGATTAVPGHDDSFTKILCDQLENLLETHKKGFSTSQLYRKIYFAQKMGSKSFLFDQAINDYGRIWLKPHGPDPTSTNPTSTDPTSTDPTSTDPQPQGASFTTSNPPRQASAAKNKKSKEVTINLRLTLSEIPDHLTMNQIATSMQYLPHVRDIHFESLRAPDEELGEFMNGLRRAHRLKPLAKRDLDAEILEQLERKPTPPETRSEQRFPKKVMQTRVEFGDNDRVQFNSGSDGSSKKWNGPWKVTAVDRDTFKYNLQWAGAGTAPNGKSSMQDIPQGKLEAYEG
ncbi:hypothetical protein K490DRAFT_66717 [Saccharata proteae CBS 121410]|uniref:Uncharacterized protein n=1 Tax=Saccharata proteae CBS 121410 TaxID=1314787 RepID=A0A9P4HUZ0_9PEZI|nr:hypothetical protein K490DRAFT_66717 [Saccharata proteae CBS 121410]